MVMSVFERTREIGILRAIGWRRSRVVRMILLESVVLSLSGGVLGTIGAMLLIRYLSTFRAVAGMVGGTVDARTIGQGFLIALLVGLVGVDFDDHQRYTLKWALVSALVLLLVGVVTLVIPVMGRTMR